jgi:5-methyltetrahydropteroyltriglutamate--homocysteine methyltransferase
MYTVRQAAFNSEALGEHARKGIQTNREEHVVTNAPIKTTLVGSYPVPEWLRVYPTHQNLVDAIKVVMKTQELAGIDLLTDGELSRYDVNHPETNGMIEYFIRPMSGIRTAFERSDWRDFHEREALGFRQKPAGIVEDAIGAGTLDLPRDFAISREQTAKPLKFTVTGPHMLSKTLIDRTYGSTEKLALALADVLAVQIAEIEADVVQVDEANISGHPEEGDWAAEAINRVLDAIRGEKAVHVCFGNYAGQTVQSGQWQALLPFLSSLRADHLVLEFKRWGIDQVGHLRDLPEHLGVGIGVIDIKDNRVESEDEIARDIETAVNTLGESRVRYVHPDCGLWMLHRSVADAKIRALVRGRDLFAKR